MLIGALGTITKGLLKGLEDLEVGGRVETIQTTALLRTTRILRRVLETWGDLLYSNSKSRKSRTVGEKEAYWYFGILKADTTKQVEMKGKMKKEYLRRTRKRLKNKWYSRNLIKGINTLIVPLVRCSGAFFKRAREELQQVK